MKTEIHSPGLRRTIDDLRVVAWRHSQLVAAGFDPALAEELAYSGSVDLHALIELVERACPPELAARILAPLDG